MTVLTELVKIVTIFITVFLLVYGAPLVFALVIRGLPHG